MRTLIFCGYSNYLWPTLFENVHHDLTISGVAIWFERNFEVLGWEKHNLAKSIHKWHSSIRMKTRWVYDVKERSWSAPWPKFDAMATHRLDLTPCDLFLWGFTKSKDYKMHPANMTEFKNRINDAFKSYGGISNEN